MQDSATPPPVVGYWVVLKSRLAGPARSTDTVVTTASGKSWVSRSLTDAMPATQIGAGALAQLAVIAAATVSELTVPPPALIALHLGLAATGAVTLGRRLSPVPFMTLLYALLTFDFAVADTVDEPIVTVAFALTSMTTPMAVILFRGRWPVAVSVLVTTIMLGSLTLVRPNVDPTLIAAIATTDASLLVAAMALMYTIRRYVDRTDRFEAEASAEYQRAMRASTARAVATENARTLHDTVINTLGALGRAASYDLDPVSARERCRQDAERVGSMLSAAEDPAGGSWWLGSGLPGKFEVRRSGIDDDELQRYEALLPSTVARALKGCVAEAIRNASKHSGAHGADIDIRVTDNDFVIVLADDGVGFDGRVIPGRGLEQSLFARARENGIRAELHTAPGQGTHITLGYRLDRIHAGPSDGCARLTEDAIVDATHRRFCWTWAVTIVAAGLVAETINRHGHLTLAHLMLVLVAVLSGLAWWVCRGGRRLPGWLSITIAVAAPAACLLAFGAVDFGRDHAFLLQTAALTPLFAILLVAAGSRLPLAISLSLLILALVAAAVLQGGSGVRPLVEVGIMSIPLFALLASWLFFYRGIGVMGRRLADAWNHAQQIRHDRVTQEALDDTRRRWNSAGLESSVALLREIANGDLDPGDDQVRRRCLEEESYLREIASLFPGHSPLSWWLALALAQARSRSVRIHFRVGSVRLQDPDQAAAFGQLALACTASAPAGGSLIVSLFTHHQEPRLFVVADHDLLSEDSAAVVCDCLI